MKRIHCIVEGQTELTVFTNILAPYIFFKTGSYISFSTLKCTGGGITNYSKLFIELRNHLRDKEKILTTFFDYYGILESHHFPNYQEAKQKQSDPTKGVQLLEQGMIEDLKSKGIETKNFVPYIQLHEFEALLFSSAEGFSLFNNSSIVEEIRNITAHYQNPESINDSPLTAPSKRIIAIFEKQGMKYEKIIDGNNIATKIGINTFMERCPRFRGWVQLLISKAL
jgi:hypothetical protein